jgi:fucose 4-O-acetylase-like acetyltransferase
MCDSGAVERDRWADALRVGSLFVVVIGHWLMVTVTPDGTISNALLVLPALQPLTWVLQVMPLFFLVGGVAHAHSLESLAARGGTGRGRYAVFVRARAVRLLRPALVFLLVWVLLGAAAHLAGWTSGPHAVLVTAILVTAPQLLWFIGMYLGVAAFAPAMFRLHRRWGAGVAVALGAGAVVVDLLRFAGGLSLVATLNYALVWLGLHQWGFVWRAGGLSQRLALGLAGVGTAGLLVAVTVGPYPTSMVGLPGEPVSNMAPPTAALLAQGWALIGFAALARGPMARLLERPRPWRGVLTAGPFAMTTFLWHVSSLLLVALAARMLGLAGPDVGTVAWWLSRPLWFLVLAVPTAVLVVLFVRFDEGPRPVRAAVDEPRAWVDPLAAVATGLAVLGILMVSVTGVDVLGNQPQFFLVAEVTPAPAFAVLLAGLGGLRLARPRVVSLRGRRRGASRAGTVRKRTPEAP